MTTWQTLLREHDPAGDAQLPPDDATVIRARAVTAASGARPRKVPWQRPLAMAAIVVLMIGSGVVAGRRAAEHDRLETERAGGPAEPGPERRQLQFSTPGGTRIIWVFNSEFDTKETTP